MTGVVLKGSSSDYGRVLSRFAVVEQMGGNGSGETLGAAKGEERTPQRARTHMQLNDTEDE